METYICGKLGWESQFKLVDWVIHGRAIRTTYSMNHFVVKYIHTWLPVGALVSKYAVKYPASCPSCACVMETQDHLLRCPARQSNRDKLFIDIRRFLAYFPTDPYVKILLQRAIRSLFLSEEFVPPPGEEKYKTLIQQQKSIGWDQLLVGRFLLEWKGIIDDHLQTIQRDKRKTETGTIWVTKILAILFHFAWDVWKDRNIDRHGRDKTDRERLLIERALLQTKELYRIRLDVLPSHRELFYESFEQHTIVEKTSRGLQQWIFTWRDVLLHSAERAQRLGTTRMNSIRQYFSPRHST